MSFSGKQYNAIFITLIILENLLLLVFPQYHILGQSLNSISFLLVSLAIGFLVLIRFYKVKAEEYPRVKPFSDKKSKFHTSLLLAAFIGVFLWTNGAAIHILKTYAISPHDSDIIPTIQILCKRFLSGKYPYSYGALSSLYYQTPSGYLPMHWLPYILAEHLKFDYRSVTFGIWCIGALFILFRSMRIPKLWLKLVIPILIAGTYYEISQIHSSIIGSTVELMVAGYYMLFIAGINQKNPWITALFISFCLLSRYSLVLWLPLWAFVLLASGNYKFLIKASIGIIILICLIYIIPFLSKDWSTFFASQINNYEKVPLTEWQHLNAQGLPIHLYHGVGMAHFFYAKFHGSQLLHGYDLFRKTFNYVIGGSILIMGIWYWRNRKNIDYRLFLLGSFKIYLALFFGFIVIPYTYLIMVGNFVSMAIFAEQARYRRLPLSTNNKVNA